MNILIVFAIGYLIIIFEHYLKVNKTAVAIFTGVICWLLYFISGSAAHTTNLSALSHYIGDIAQILFFLLGAMTLVETIDSHKGFNSVIRLIHTRSKRKVLIIVSLLTFFLSAILDNLTTTIVMISILKKIVPHQKERLALGCMVVIAANAGGAWTPIGDITTTMLWINGQLSTLAIIKKLFLPSIICMLVPLGIYLIRTKGNYTMSEIDYKTEPKEPGADLVFCVGLLGLMGVPVFKWATGLPPFMGMIGALAILWIVTDLLHFKYDHREHLRLPSVLTRIDAPTMLFFLGILLAVDVLDVSQFLDKLAVLLNTYLGGVIPIATAIGLLSAVIDNVPLVAATMGMYDLVAFPIDSDLWMLIAYAAGTGGSVLVIGSASGVALMGLEKVDFIAYLKKATIPALLGFLAGILMYVIIGMSI
ncbi:MAG: sodium:proton antiporter NhaD [Chlamydiales bacterium]|nr:sodium:proton antiporter NhaD [Chlamydiales bacterium]